MVMAMKLLDFIFPPRCIVSGDIVDRQGMVSPAAWSRLNFITAPFCLRCGFPFDFDSGDGDGDDVCGACLKTPPVYNRARSALVYDDASRPVILGFKHGDQTQNVPAFLPWLERAGAALLEDADYLVPVPLHRWRLAKRRFNQSALLAQALGKEMSIPCLSGALMRIRATPTQGHLQAGARHKNVKNAFAVNEKMKDRIRGRNIVLIDDVFTTGATMNECTKVLYQAGAGRVDLLTLARVVRPQRL
jgi:ComF family protein